MSAPTTLNGIVLDCADPAALAAFYAAATGAAVTYEDAGFVTVGAGLSFQRVDGYRAPGWPDPAKQAHVDLKATGGDVEVAVKELVGLGATRPQFQPGDGWTVLLDPAGHPFCVTG